MVPGGENLVGVYENTHIHDAMVNALLGTSYASASTSSPASTTKSAGAGSMPDTGGPTFNSTLLAATALLIGVAGIAYVRRVVRAS